jgi:putative membrane protein
MTLAADAAVDIWRWQPHPEVWVLVAGLTFAWVWALRRIGPRAVLPGERVTSPGQVAWMAGALAVLWLASDWPVHDIAEEYLYSVHMAQHLMLTLVFPPMFLLGTPTWLARLVVGSGRGYAVYRRLSRLVPATVLFNGVLVFSHWPAVVDGAVQNALAHYGLHLLSVLVALLMWTGVCGPLPELRFALPVQMAHLFLQSVVPTVPAGWLLFADHTVYDVYDRTGKIWGMTAVFDQQFAAALMKVGAGTYLWLIIGSLFFKFAARHERELGEGWANDFDRGVDLDRRSPDLTFEEVERAFEIAGPAPQEA